jgi:hypothetical protein
VKELHDIHEKNRWRTAEYNTNAGRHEANRKMVAIKCRSSNLSSVGDESESMSSILSVPF